MFKHKYKDSDEYLLNTFDEPDEVGVHFNAIKGLHRTSNKTQCKHGWPNKKTRQAVKGKGGRGYAKIEELL
jgi:hypothetical protein